MGENRDFFCFHRRSPALEQSRSPVDGLASLKLFTPQSWERMSGNADML